MGRTTGRKVGGKDEAVALLEEWSASSEPMSTWCKQRGISWYSLLGFKGLLNREPREPHEIGLGRGNGGDADGEGPRFLEVENTAVVLHRTQFRYRVLIGPRVVEVDGDFDDQVLGRLLRVVASC